LLYLHTEVYNKSTEGGVRFDDPMLNIDWPLAPTELSIRDQNHLLLTDQFPGI
jgi:dTDP-4-dehydrorhamnose 3,5-epimerase